MPIKVFIKEGSSIPGYQPSFKLTAKDSFTEWASASNGKISFVYTDNLNEADISCRWSDNQADTPMDTACGNAHMSRIGNVITHEEITFLTLDPIDRKPIKERLVKELCLHEIGHALGLQHSQNAEDIMFYIISIAEKDYSLSPGDKQALLDIYEINHLE